MSRKRKLKELTDADIAACEPESIWLETRRCPIPAVAVFWAVVLMLVSGIVWACLAKVDKVVTAEGKLVTTRPDVILKPLERAVIKRVDVQVGQIVEEGDTLITFDPTVNEARLRALQQEYDTHRCRRLRLLAEQKGDAHFELPAELAETEPGRRQQQLWQTRHSWHTEKHAWYRENIARYTSVAHAVESALAKYAEMMQPMNSIEAMYTTMVERGSVARVDMYQVQMQRMGNEIEIEKQRATLVENKQMLLSAEKEERVFEQEWQRDIATELAETELRMSALSESINETAYLAATETLKSPCRAMVHEIAPYQEGSGVREAEAVITLIPLDTPLEAQIDILPRDIGMVRKGDIARVKLDAFPFQQYGTLQGRLRFISANTYDSSSNMEAVEDTPPPSGRQPQYRAYLSLGGALDGVPETLWQVSGMKLRAEIKVGERRVITYLFNPFIKAMDEAIREP